MTRKLLEWGGIAAGIVLIAFGIGALWMSFDARSTVQDELAREQIVGGPVQMRDECRRSEDHQQLTGEDGKVPL